MALFFHPCCPLPTVTSSHRAASISPRRPRRNQYTVPRMDSTPPPPEKPSTPDAQGEALVRASMQGAAGDVQDLLSSGASAGYASTQNESGMTALMWAAAEGHVDIARTLLDAGASPNATNAAGMSALLYAFDNFPNANPRPAPPPGFPGEPGRFAPPQIPVVARVTGHSPVAKMLLAAGADAKIKNNYGETLLHMAARKAQGGWVDLCVSAGIGLEERSLGYEETALHVAAKEGHTDIVKQLCESGAVADARSRYGWTPLIWASACACVGALQVLLEYGADANARSVTGAGVAATTPLQEARKCSDPVVVSKLLIRAGAIE